MLGNGSKTDVKYVKALYNALLNSTGTALLDADDITGSSITIKDKNENGTYNTDVGFILDAKGSELAGDLMVNIMNGTEVLKSARLSGYDNKSDLGDITRNADGSYTIKDVVLAEGVKITLNISGLQQSAAGVKIYVSEIIDTISSQTLIGLTKGDRKVDINVDLKFDVTEPEAAKVSGTDDKTQIWNTTRTDSRTDIRTDVKTDTNYTTSTKVTTVEEVNTKVYATITVTEVIEEDSKTERAWESSWTKTYTYDDPEYPIELYNDEYPIPEKKNPADENLLTELIDEEIPLAGLPEEELVVLFDEMVPLASIPRTGETSVPWLALSLLSVSGLLGLYLTDKKKKA